MIWWQCALITTSLFKVVASQNRIWPEEPRLDTATLRELVQSTCAQRVSKAVVGPDSSSSWAWVQPVTGPLAWVIKLRRAQGYVPEAFIEVALGCGLDDDLCNEAWAEYAKIAAWPLSVPLVIGGLCLLLHCTCCFVACCRCCRRMVCCHEGHEPREVPQVCAILAVGTWLMGSLALVALGCAMQEVNFTLHTVLDDHMCAALNLGDEAVGGSELFLGTELAVEQLRDIGAGLDVDGSTMRAVRSSIQTSEEFARRHDVVQRRISHFVGVLSKLGPQGRAFDHGCVFCSIALGDPDHPIPGLPAEGLLPALLQEVASSSSEAIERIRNLALAHLVDANLTLVARQVKRALAAVGSLDTAFKVTVMDKWGRRSPSVNTVESMRLASFMWLTTLSLVTVALGWLAFLITRLRFQARPDLVPSGKPHLASWCCGFCTGWTAMMHAGALVMLTVATGEGCIFLREELATVDGYARHAVALRLGEPLAIQLAQSCLTDSGSGELTEVLGLTEPLNFQVDLMNAFYTLDAIAEQPPAGQDSARHLADLHNVAQQFGGLFVLDPPAQAGNGSLGLLPLSPNVRDLLLGSGTEPDDVTGPDGFTRISGLNSFAALIAGPGKYTFAHGTAGGGFVITPTRPTNEEMETLPEPTRSALLYARAKEQLLTSADALHCDTFDALDYSVTERRCSIAQFHSFVSSEVQLLQDAVDALSAEAEAVERQFSQTLKAEVLPMLRKMRDIRTDMGCKALYNLYETLEKSTCEELAPVCARGALTAAGLAAAAAVCVLAQYKIWRHLKDNKVLKIEVARFEERLRKFDEQMAAIHDDMTSDAAQKEAWRKSVAKRMDEEDAS